MASSPAPARAWTILLELAGCATVSGGGRGGRDGDQPRPDAARERGAAVRGARRRPARARARADRRRSPGDASQVREAVSAPARVYRSSSTERMFPEGSLNQAIRGPGPSEAIPFASVLIGPSL